MADTTRPKAPFLYIDLEKAVWKEEKHKRDASGKFTNKGGGAVSKTDKKEKDKAKADKSKGTKTTKKTEAKNTKDTKKKKPEVKDTKEAKKQDKKKKAAAEKGKTTKATNKANGTGKSTDLNNDGSKKTTKPATKKTSEVQKPAAKDTKTKTTEAPKKDTKAKKPAAPAPAPKPAAEPKKSSKPKKEAPKQEAPKDTQDPNETVYKPGEANVSGKRVPIEPGSKAKDGVGNAQNQALKELNQGTEEEAENAVTVDKMWNEKDVQALMKKAPEKRSEAKIRELAGKITTENDKLARYVTLQMGKSRGLNLLSQVNRIGDGGQSGNAEVINQETGYYGDLLQAARASMYETLYRVMKGSQNVKEGTPIGAHVVSRIKQKLHNDIYDLMNEVPAPHEIRGAIADMSKAEKELQQTLGRNPSTEELANHLQENSKNFKSAPIMEAPQFDEKTGQWVAVKKRVEDPAERLRMLKVYTEQQKTTSIDKNVGSEGEKEVSLADNIEDSGATPDEAYEKKERQKELQGAIPKALDAMGLNEKEKMVFMIMFGSPSAKSKKTNMTQEEVADEINARGGYEDGKQATQTWVNKYYRSALQKIMEARQNNHPALQELSLLKSLFYNMIMKAMYEYDLVKSLHNWGVGLDALTTKYARSAHGANLLSLRKSLAPHEYIGSVVVTEDGGIHARIVEFTLPEDNALYKSFNAAVNSLKKSMFPHKGKSNHSVNSKAGEYIKANKAKYSSMSDAQHAAAKAKNGGLTWSQQLLLDNPGSAWITWGGKRILVNVGDGSILYDSANEAHREEKNQGAQSDKIDFHHEKEELDRNEKERGEAIQKRWEESIVKNAKKKAVDWSKERDDFSKRNRGVGFDEDGNLVFQGDGDLTDENRASIDHGIQAFKEHMETMRKEWKEEIQPKMKEENKHRVSRGYTVLSEEQREAVEAAKPEERANLLGKAIVDFKREEIEGIFNKYNEMAAGINPKDKEAVKQFKEDFAKEMQSLEKKDFSLAVANGDKMKTLAGKLLDMKGGLTSENQAELETYIGEAEISRGNEEASKKLLPEGAFMIGNPVTGATMVVKFSHGFGEGNKNSWTAKIAEAFDPEGGNHEDLYSWGGLGRALGLGNSSNLQEILAQYANMSEDKPFMKQLTEEEYGKLRSNTKLGLQETMKHKDFKLVSESRDRSGKVTHRTFAQDMPDGTQNTIHVDAKGYISDPVMARLLKQRKPIENINDLHEVMKQAVGNRAWVTAHFGSDVHIGDALGHHVQLEYDGKGAPRVVGGKYDGYRFMDTNDIPKDAVDPATGEPIKALFKNGKLIDRKFTTKNAVPMEEGNAVLYDAGDGKYKKGRIHSIQDGVYKITDGKHHVIGMFDKSELKPAMVEGKANAESGQATVRVAKTGVHRMNTTEVFKGNEKAQELFKQALQKAKIKGVVDSEGNLDEKLELSDKEHAALKKVLGRSKAGKAIMQNFRSANTKDLQIHIPENLRAQIEAEGVTIGANGTAKISVGKFEQLREVLGGVSLDYSARKFLEEHFNRKDRRPMDERMDEITKTFQPGAVDEKTEFGKAYRSQFKETSFLMDKNTGLYSAQLQGVAHLIERGRGIVGHGINYTLAMTFVA